MTSLRLVGIVFLVCATVILPAYVVWQAVAELTERLV